MRVRTPPSALKCPRGVAGFPHATLRSNSLLRIQRVATMRGMETKRCSQCRKHLPIDQYNWKNRARGIRYSYCKTCWNELNKGRYLSNKRYYIDKAQRYKEKFRRWLMELKESMGCSLCPERHPACLLFHHREPNHKDFEIGDAMLVRSKERIDAEIKKCMVLCANCHAKLHFKLRGGVWPLPPECEGFARSPAETEEEVRLL